ncbi:hypothetical protein PAMA_003674 [Pampus argenteus]
MSVTSWFLVSSSGTRHRLPREMIFVGRDDCELMLQSRSVDKQHAVINYDPNADEHMVKDLGSLNGHEKYTSQLQLSMKALEAKVKEKQQLQSSDKSKYAISNIRLQDRPERRAQSLTAATDSAISKPTPLYGQPSWWGEDEDPANKKQNRGGKSPEQESPEPAKDVSRYEVNGSDSQAKSIFSYRREPSYFEIQTKELQQQSPKKAESHIHEVPTKDTPDLSQRVPSTPTPPVMQSHASFTIEFDDCTPGKMKIKDHVTKFSFRQQRKLPSTDVVGTPTEVMSAENKVADWLVHSNASMMKRRSQTEDVYSTKSDPSLLKITKVNRGEDGAHTDSCDPEINGKNILHSEPQTGSQVSPRTLRSSPALCFTSPDSEEPTESGEPPESQSLSSLGKADTQQAFVIEFFDDNLRKKRSQSFTSNTVQPEPSGLRVQLEKAKKSSSPTGERHVPSPASTTPPTQRYTIPLKGCASTGPQRAGSLRREKTEDWISTTVSSRSPSSVSVRPFSSVGRRSKLAKEFTAELLKQAKQAASTASWEKNTCSPPATALTGTKVASQCNQRSPSPSSPPNAPYQPQTSSPIHQPVPLKAPMMPLASQSHGGPRNEEEDSLSDAGTYTIEADVQDKELEEARRKIDRAKRTNQIEAETSSAFRPVIGQGREQHRQSSSGEMGPAPEQGQGLVKVQPAGAVLQGAPKWMSCWASLADGYTESGPSSGLFDIHSQMELTGGGMSVCKATLSRNHEGVDFECSRTCSILPQVTLGEKNDTSTPSIHVHYDPHSTFDVEEKSLVAPRSHKGIHRLSVQDDVEPDSLSDASKSDDGSIIERRGRTLSDAEDKKNVDKPKLPAKSTSFYIGSEETESQPEHGSSKPNTPKTERKHPIKTFSTATLTKQRGNQDSGKVKPSVSAPILGPGTQSPDLKEGAMAPLIRQESFTKEQPSDARLPNISSEPPQRDPDPNLFQGSCNQDTQSYLKQTEDVLAVLEAKLQAGQSETTPSPIMDSLSGDSDVDTSSTVSQHSNKTRTNTLTKKNSISGFHREKSSASIASQDSTSERLSERRRSQGTTSSKKPDSVKRSAGLRRSVGKCGSTDLSDDLQSSSVPYSDQESNTHQTRKKYTVPLQKEETKNSRVSQALSRANSLSAPRPTRASMLRRARLGEASDNEGNETDRLSQEAGNTLAKQPQETKKLSRLDMLAMPRKRTSSFNTPSDTEVSSTSQWTGRSMGFSNRSSESSCSSTRRASAPGPKPVERLQKAAPNKTPVIRGRVNSTKYASSTASSRRRQKGSDYASTSDEEYDSNQSTPKHKRSQPSSASHSPRRLPQPQPVVALRPKPRSRDSEDENHEGDAFHNWSSHSAEIARLSQDLAKDLAILAREIHDVAGEGEPQDSAVESSTPVSTVTTHEQVNQTLFQHRSIKLHSSVERGSMSQCFSCSMLFGCWLLQLVQQIPEAGLNYQRVPPNSAPTMDSVQNQSDNEQNSRQRVCSREEVIVNSLMLNPVSQIIVAIRENTEQLAEKMKYDI